jgi:hypothetical protein
LQPALQRFGGRLEQPIELSVVGIGGNCHRGENLVDEVPSASDEVLFGSFTLVEPVAVEAGDGGGQIDVSRRADRWSCEADQGDQCARPAHHQHPPD